MLLSVKKLLLAINGKIDVTGRE